MIYYCKCKDNFINRICEATKEHQTVFCEKENKLINKYEQLKDSFEDKEL